MSHVWMVPHAGIFLIPFHPIWLYIQTEGDVGFGVTWLALFSPLLEHLWAMELAPQPNAHQVTGKAESWERRRLLGKEHAGWQREWPVIRGMERLGCVAERTWGRTESLVWGRLWRMWRGGSTVGKWQLWILGGESSMAGLASSLM